MISKIKTWFLKNKKIITIVAASILLAIIIFPLLIVRSTERKAVFSYTESVDLNSLTYIGYVIDEDGVAKANSNDPQIWLPVTDKKINDVCIKFSFRPKESDGSQLFYSTDGSLSEANSISKSVYYQKELYFTIPDGIYRTLRVDIEGEFQIESVSLSYATDINEFYRYHLVLEYLLLLLIIASIIAIIAIFFKRQTKSTYLFIKNRYFSTEEAEINNSRNMANIYFTLSIIFGLLLIFLNPPFVCPDETAHFINVCRVSHGNLFAIVENGQVGCYLTQNEIDFICKYSGLYNGISSPKFNYSELYNLSQLLPQTSMQFFPTEFATINVTPYIPSGIVVGIARTMVTGIHPYSLLILAKITNLFFSSLIIRLAIMKTPIMRNTMFMLALMPMSIYQTSSVSYDSITIAFSFLLFAYGTKILLSDNDYVITIKDILAVCISFALICGSKIAYAPLIFVLLAISIKKFGNLKKYFICIGAIAALGIVFYLIPTIVNNTITSGIVFADSDKIAAQREYYYNNIWKTPTIISATTKHFYGYWIETFFGILGALDTYFPAAMRVLFLSVSTLTAITDLCLIKKLKISARLLSLATVMLITSVSIIAIYIEWNPRVIENPTGNIAYGMQGRYFIPIALFALLPFGNTFLSKFKYKNNILAIEENVIKIICTGFLILTSALLLIRFWI